MQPCWPIRSDSGTPVSARLARASEAKQTAQVTQIVTQSLFPPRGLGLGTWLPACPVVLMILITLYTCISTCSVCGLSFFFPFSFFISWTTAIIIIIITTTNTSIIGTITAMTMMFSLPVSELIGSESVICRARIMYGYDELTIYKGRGEDGAI